MQCEALADLVITCVFQFCLSDAKCEKFCIFQARLIQTAIFLSSHLISHLVVL